MFICGDKWDINIHITPVFSILLWLKSWSFLGQLLCIIIFCVMHIIAFRCNWISCTIFMLSFFFSIHVMSMFFVGFLCRVYVTLFVYMSISWFFFDMHMIAFRCNWISCTIFMLSFFFSIHVMPMFFVGFLCQVCETLFVYLKINSGLYCKNIHFIQSCG